MFEHYSETKQLFNPFRKKQPRKYSAAVMAHIVSKDNLDVLTSYRVSIARQHMIAGVKSKHYGMMARCLTVAMNEVLQDKVSEETFTAWHLWFMYFTSLMIEREKRRYNGSHRLFPEKQIA